ncbi:MAG: hypothetical protein FWG89_11355 [Treponema sp.]|nr:hypothetical protein [Treponema sp.]
MKRMLTFGLTLLLAGTALFADDAKVMPSLVGRFYVAPTFSFAPGFFDADGKYQSYDNGAVKVFNLGFALEFGLNDWITAALQWVPGFTPWSNVEAAVPAAIAAFRSDNSYNTNGVADLFAGAKIQIAGENAPLKNSAVRFALAPGLIIPMPGPEFDKEFEKVYKGEAITFSNMDNHVFGAGGRVYLDFVINENFFINLYNETIFYPLRRDLDRAGPNLAAAKELIPMGIFQEVYTSSIASGHNEIVAGLIAGGARDAARSDLEEANGKVGYRYRLTFEIEPVYSTPIADGISFSAGLPINYRYTPAFDYSVSDVGNMVSTMTGGQIDAEEILLEQLKGTDEGRHSLSIIPNASIFITKTLLPLEFKLQYGIPVWGRDTMARHNLVFQIRAYFAFGR